jgi:hypothetical protein
MRHTLLYIFAILFVWVFLAQCIFMRGRWNDKKVYRIFKTKNVLLAIFDTVIYKHQIHYAVSGPVSLPTFVFIYGSPGAGCTTLHLYRMMPSVKNSGL